METIGHRIVAITSPIAASTRIADVRIGLGYTAVQLDEGATGVAYTFHDKATGGCEVFKGMRPLAGRPATDLLGLLTSCDPVEAAVGLATANACLNRPRYGHVHGDVLEQLAVTPSDRVGMVGYFGPLVGPLRRIAGALDIFELRDLPETTCSSDALEGLQSCDVALITATAIINGTIDRLLEATRDCRQTTLVGASTPLCPEAFGHEPPLLSGVVVREPSRVLQVVSEGGGMRQFRQFVDKVCLSSR